MKINPTIPLPELLRRDDMAALLGYCLSQIDFMRRRGELPESFKMGKARYWRREDVQAWVQQMAMASKEVAQ